MKHIKLETEFSGKTLILETGKFATRATNAVICTYGETSVIAILTVGEEKDLNFLPLFVDYREKLYSAGKIKGSRWVKREGRPADEEILLSRMIDRTIRPLIDKNIRNDISLNIMPLSVDGENEIDFVASMAANVSLFISGLPFSGPVSTIFVGLENEKFTVNPTFSQKENQEMILTLANNSDKTVMIEFEGKEISEEKAIEGFEFAISQNKILSDFQEKFKKEYEKEFPEKNLDISKFLGFQERKESEKEKNTEFSEIPEDLKTKFSEAYSISDVIVRNKKLDEIFSEYKKENENEEKQEQEDSEKLENKEEILDVKSLYHEFVRYEILENKNRVAGRKIEQVRDLEVEVGLFPRIHGSGHFRRGETEALTIATIGSPADVALYENTSEEGEKRFFHMYNFPSYSVGETFPKRFVSRREIGHGALAEKALKNMIPSKEDFPYTIQLVTEILTSNGSTSMAATCGSTLALMDAGVPISNPVSGVAIGLIIDDEDENKWVVLSDIQGEEDHLGYMDFKMTRTKKGITGIQMDTKTKGVSMEIVRESFRQGKNACLHILEKMTSVISRPRPELSKYAPRIRTLKIHPDKIKLVIGRGGETVQKITKESESKIDIEEQDENKALIYITSPDDKSYQKAYKMIQDVLYEAKIDDEFSDLKVYRIEDFGAFVKNDKIEGMIHISKISKDFVKNIRDIIKIGDTMSAKIIGIDERGRINLKRI